MSLPGNKKAPYCYDAFVLLGRWSKGTLFNYLLYFFFLLTTVVPMAAPDSWFSHLAVEVPGDETSNEWCEQVSGEAYGQLE